MTFPTTSILGYGLTARIEFVFSEASNSYTSWPNRSDYLFLLFCHLNSQTTAATTLLLSYELLHINTSKSKTYEEGSKQENAWTRMWIAGIFYAVTDGAPPPWVSSLPADRVSFMCLSLCCPAALPCFLLSPWEFLWHRDVLYMCIQNSTYRNRGSAVGLLAWGSNTFLS